MNTLAIIGYWHDKRLHLLRIKDEVTTIPDGAVIVFANDGDDEDLPADLLAEIPDHGFPLSFKMDVPCIAHEVGFLAECGCGACNQDKPERVMSRE